MHMLILIKIERWRRGTSCVRNGCGQTWHRLWGRACGPTRQPPCGHATGSSALQTHLVRRCLARCSALRPEPRRLGRWLCDRPRGPRSGRRLERLCWGVWIGPGGPRRGGSHQECACGAAEVDRHEWGRKRSKTPHGGVARQIRPRCAVGVLWGIRERPQASPMGSESSRGFGRARRRSPKAKPEGEARRRSPKAKPEGEAPPKSRPILFTPLKRPTPTNTGNSTQRTPSGGGTTRKPQTNAEKTRPIARRARAAAAAEAEARRGNRTP